MRSRWNWTVGQISWTSLYIFFKLHIKWSISVLEAVMDEPLLRNKTIFVKLAPCLTSLEVKQWQTIKCCLYSDRCRLGSRQCRSLLRYAVPHLSHANAYRDMLDYNTQCQISGMACVCVIPELHIIYNPTPLCDSEASCAHSHFGFLCSYKLFLGWTAPSKNWVHVILGWLTTSRQTSAIQ